MVLVVFDTSPLGAGFFIFMKFVARLALIGVASFFVMHLAYATPPASRAVLSSKSVQQVGYSTGEIKTIDTKQGLVTLKHRSIDNLGMPDMTMVFRLVHPEQAVSFKVGDMVRFKAERVNGLLVITELVNLK